VRTSTVHLFFSRYECRVSSAGQNLSGGLPAAPAGHLVDNDEIERFIEGVAHHDGGPENVKRVAAQLAAAGWPLAGIDADGIWTDDAAVES